MHDRSRQEIIDADHDANREVKRLVRYGDMMIDEVQILIALKSRGGWDDMVVMRFEVEEDVLDSVIGTTVKSALGDRKEVRDVLGRTIRKWWWDEECEVTVLHLEEW